MPRNKSSKAQSVARKRHEKEDDAALEQYLAPGTTLHGSDDDDSDCGEIYDLVPNKGTSNVTAGNNLTRLSTGAAGEQQVKPNTQAPATAIKKAQPAVMENRILNKICVDDFFSGAAGGGGGARGGAMSAGDAGKGAKKMNQKVMNELRDATKAAGHRSSHNVDRSERATVENAIDPRTRLLLYKMVNSGILSEINGCVSTGKEANVYYARTGAAIDLHNAMSCHRAATATNQQKQKHADPSPKKEEEEEEEEEAAKYKEKSEELAQEPTSIVDVAIKIFKTSILVFKDRERYVAGEFRFQRFCKSNPRKMVRTWAEKEARNLARLRKGGVRVPEMKLLRQHIIIMEFIGHDGWPAPRLKTVDFGSNSALERTYMDLCATVRRMFQVCHLVHGDLSEYNLLVHDGQVVVIDVSQSVEHDHPESLTFLRRDIVNVNKFFKTKGLVSTMPLQVFYDFVVTPPCQTTDDAGVSTSSTSSSVTAAGGKKSAGPASEKRAKVSHSYDDVKLFFAENKERWMEANQRSAADPSATSTLSSSDGLLNVDERVFLSVNVPTTLDGISTMRKPNKEIAGFVDDLLTKKTNGGNGANDSGSSSDEEESEEEDDDEEGEEDEENDEDEEGEDGKGTTGGACLADMSKDERKDHKKLVKEANRERRKNKKMSKGEKKRLICKAAKKKKHK